MSKKNPLIKVWSGTPVHESLDYRLHKSLVDKLKLAGLNAEFRGDYSFEELGNGKKALVTHPARGAYRYRLTPSQTDAEEIHIDVAQGKLPRGIKMLVTAHCHTLEGSIDHVGIKVLRTPAFVTFMPYSGSLKKLVHWQPDIGAWFVIITKDGRIHSQEWLYQPFMYHQTDDKIIITNNPEKTYVNTGTIKLESYLKVMLKNAVKVIMIVADLHVGEKEAVMPPTFLVDKRVFPVFTEPYDREKSIGTPANALLYKYWKHLIRTAMKEFKVDEIWLVGDASGGTNVFDKFRDLITANLDNQVSAIVELFKLIKTV